MIHLQLLLFQALISFMVLIILMVLLAVTDSLSGTFALSDLGTGLHESQFFKLYYDII